MTTITRDQALDVLLSELHPETRELVETILAAAAGSRTPEDLRQRMEVVATTHQSMVALLRTAMLGGACAWIEEGKKVGCGEEECYRIAAVTLEWSAAMLIRRLYQKIGKPFSPGRFGIVACDQAIAATKFPMGIVDQVIADAEALGEANP